MITLILGECGSGKSLHGCKLAINYKKKGYNIYSNMYLKGAYSFCIDDLMLYSFKENSILLFDEALSMGLGSRGNMSKKTSNHNVNEFFSMYRHYGIKDIIVVSPCLADIIPIVRENTNIIYYAHKSFLNALGYNVVNRLYKYIDKSNGSFDYKYYEVPYSYQIYKRKRYYKYYDSYCKKELLYKDFKKW